jgi:hypothetical protein
MIFLSLVRNMNANNNLSSKFLIMMEELALQQVPSLSEDSIEFSERRESLAPIEY